jgi:hypothetical protein
MKPSGQINKMKEIAFKEGLAVIGIKMSENEPSMELGSQLETMTTL